MLRLSSDGADDAPSDRPSPESDGATRDQTCEGGDPVTIATGEFLLPVTDLDLPGILRLALELLCTMRVD
ncbi:hypothetical protein GCM10011610_67670 [Nocardia rhizosphaerihabitans]|uniref:DUF6531 domain-containing protein n=1 Tax=Nocardia rhizosphaerihabitans TaxID=1691570 RepID=A0ABQ2L1I9_9NOCA|nr:hypothetical protein GCM10011610_67670 [Nocardia rhizosphaerihabitans]